MSSAAEAACVGCGGPLPEARYVATTTCSFCRREQPNPRPLPVGHEVIADGHLGALFA